MNYAGTPSSIFVFILGCFGFRLKLYLALKFIVCFSVKFCPIFLTVLQSNFFSHYYVNFKEHTDYLSSLMVPIWFIVTWTISYLLLILQEFLVIYWSSFICWIPRLSFNTWISLHWYFFNSFLPKFPNGQIDCLLN